MFPAKYLDRSGKIGLAFLLGMLFFSHPYAFPQEEITHIDKALSCLDYMEYEEALVHISRAIEENSKRKGLGFYEAFALYQLGNTGESLGILREEIRKFPDSLYSHILLSYILYLQGKPAEAAQAGLDFDTQLNRALRIHSGYNEGPFKLKMTFYNMGLPYFIVGLHYKNSERYSNAIKYFGYAMRGEYNPAECYCQMIDTELVRENGKRALSRIRQAIERAGAQAEFYVLMGYTHYQLGQVDDALSCFKEAVRLKPYFVEAVRNLAAIHFNQKRYGEAAVLFDKVLKLRPDDKTSKLFLEKSLDLNASGQSFENLPLTKDFVDRVRLEFRYPVKGDINERALTINSWALSSIREGKLEEAKRMLSQFLEINDAPAQLYYNLGQLHNVFDEYEAALFNAHKAVKLDRNFKEAFDLIGNIYFDLEDYEHSLIFYEETAKFSPVDAVSLYNLGCVHYALEQQEKAEKCWKETIRFDRGEQRIEDSKKKIDDTLASYITVHKESASLKAHKSLARLYLGQELIDRALRHYRSAYKLSPNDSELCLNLGKIYFNRNEWSEALRYLEKYLFLGGEKEEEVKQLIASIKRKDIRCG